MWSNAAALPISDRGPKRYPVVWHRICFGEAALSKKRIDISTLTGFGAFRRFPAIRILIAGSGSFQVVNGPHRASFLGAGTTKRRAVASARRCVRPKTSETRPLPLQVRRARREREVPVRVELLRDVGNGEGAAGS
jgi:hypothetical protein